MTIPAALAASIEKLKPLVQLAVPTGPSDGSPRGARNANPKLLTEAVTASVMLARACIKLGEMREARSLLAAVETPGEDHADWLRLQSRLDQMGGDYRLAEARLARLAGLGTANAADHVRLGRLRLELGRAADARHAFFLALKADPDDYEALCEITHFALLDGDFTAASRLTERALQIRPGAHLARLNRAQIAIALGKTAEALADLDAVLAGNPDNIDAHVLKSRLVKRQRGDADLKAMAALWVRTDLGPRQRVRLGFALAKGLEDCGDLARAFQVLTQANQLKYREIGPVDGEAEAGAFGALETHFTSDAIAALKPAMAGLPRPLFIVGLPRSGTSLIEQMLACHSDIEAGGESDRIGRLVRDRAMEADGRFRPLDRVLLNSMALKWRAETVKLARGKAVFTDKMPVNYLNLGFILTMFPDAVVVHMTRDRLANAFALYASNFETRGMPWAYDIEALGRHIRAYEQLMAHWHTVFPGRIIDVSYEALTVDPEPVLTEILAAAGLHFEPACLDFHDSGRPVMTMSASQVNQPLRPGADRRTPAFGALLDPLRQALGEARQ